MKKKVLGLILTTALLVAQSVNVFAAGSRTADVALSGDSAGKYEVAEATAETFAELAETQKEVVDKILEINAGTKDIQSIAEEAPELAADLEDKSMITPFFDLIAVNGGVKDADGNYVVTLSVPTLTEAVTDVKVLHYSTVRNVWEVITPSNVDYENKALTAAFQDLSPVAVIGNVDESKVNNADTAAVGTSPKTGAASSWMMFGGAAVVLLAVGTILVKGKNNA